MKKRYQLLIVGAGPAGAYAATEAARAGLDVLLADRKIEIGRPVCCAEATSLEGLSTFVEPRREFISTEINSVKMTVSTGKELLYDFGNTLGYVLDRPAFEKFLIDRAIERGVEFIGGAYVHDISINGNALASIQTDTGEYQIESDYIIGADGVESQIGRMAGLETGLDLEHCETTLQYYVTNIEIEPNCLLFYVGDTYSPNGYLWVFPKSENSANIGVGLNPYESDSKFLREKLDKFIKENFPGGRVEFETCGMVPKFKNFDTLGRENILLAGDAARIIDSVTGAGIARALHTGQLAAQVIAEAIDTNLPHNQMQELYRSRVEKAIGRDMNILSKAYPVFRKFDNRDWEILMEFLEGYLKNRTAESIDPAAMIKSVLTSAPRLLRLTRHLF
ncbi:MAG: NAD(P)/FAD-dependent oxidoreductase [candidate division Zixibacteria bacterium]